MSLLGNDDVNPSTGELINQSDSTIIAFDDLRIVNAKLLELEYQKAINNNLNQIVANDKIIISQYANLNKDLNIKCNKYIKQRNIAIGVGAGVAAALITSLIFIAK